MAALRGIKNKVGNYPLGEVKVREATTNEAWGPSTTQMAEISDLSYELLHFHDINVAIEKRLNDKGKNFRHVLKALILLDYILKTGPEKTIQYWKEKTYVIATLKDFQFYDKETKDQGHNIRERSKQITSLLEDSDLLNAEREKSIETKKKFHSGSLAPSTGDNSRIGNLESKSWEPGRKTYPHTSPAVLQSPETTSSKLSADLKAALPSNKTEEEIQLQVALAISKEATPTLKAQAERASNSGGVSLPPPPGSARDQTEQEYAQLQKALAVSKEENDRKQTVVPDPPKSAQLITDEWILDMNGATTSNTMWGNVHSAQPALTSHDTADWGSSFGDVSKTTPLSNSANDDPWSGAANFSGNSAVLEPTNLIKEIITTKDPWGDSPTTDTTNSSIISGTENSSLIEPASAQTFSILDIDKQNTIEENFLGSSNAKLVNLDALMGLNLGSTVNSNVPSPNPFALTTAASNSNKTASNPFTSNTTAQPSLSQMISNTNIDPLGAPLIPEIAGYAQPSYPPQQTHAFTNAPSTFQPAYNYHATNLPQMNYSHPTPLFNQQASTTNNTRSNNPFF